MMKTLSTFVGLLVLSVFVVCAEDVTVELRDGSTIKGKLISKSPDSVTVSTMLGEQTISAQQLSSKSIAELQLPSSDDPAYLKQKIADLERQVSALRAENQQLRKLLSQQTTAPPAAPSVQRPTPPASSQPATGYWMSSTGKRHNPRCRYYMTTKGGPCGPNDGIPCKICGG